jgi:glucose-1-phosphate cytidylyltransferase
MVTYGDGVSNVCIPDLLDFHRSHGKLATLTAVRPPARFGQMELEEDRVKQFEEKPQIGEGWINGGFFVLEPQIIDYIADQQSVWEREPLERLAADGQLMAYRHADFWQCMDTLRDLNQLERMWQESRAPWKIW